MKTLLTNARIVLADCVLENASLLLEDGVIAAVNPETAPDARVENLSGKTLLPGMIDLHCDALEKEVEPRPNVHFPLDFACAQADKRNAAAGITTVFHALSFANEELGVRNNAFAASIARAVHDWMPHALVDNRVHCRYEITDPTGFPVLLDLLEKQEAHLISFMDHTPGQGQFKDVAAYRDYIARTYQKSEAELDALLQRKQDEAAGAIDRIQTLVAAAHAQGIATASHDDDTPERVATMTALGVNISEFPINLATAQAACDKGMHTIFGAPNILRGKSQAGSMRAVDAIHAGVATCLCADYAPAALIVAVFKLVEDAVLTLPQAVQLVANNPAKAAGLHDRGEIAVGKRADLIAVSHLGALPQVADVWVQGAAAYRVQYDHT
ncbi:alpha-D-ribose 1-methylphosphonate 5-triphosphate diphosphatase [Thiothrix subterranea]|uniref:Alpha-D-ribose 1-methylphosphonate 5-triphosphate diphosphatase n=1 Tax=Thiothrix subterranea TaxID=2735563 RepID=A0AA51R2Q9_9GAMM|nr:alpha-D-ribose 1-methylphosphonate 5-triphosphate diphosphatase [Thiothrix subterranea]MDQ5768710.1 alpha-D-ribose 1-methylphosphonate 5-triphosphate diphosphatase [Thiothrix subterranea]WML84861.1 alpha-D-ribose 1-methylphosphonate 5-triphosphate diphosphatase [Thiothrix subterranea]